MKSLFWLISIFLFPPTSPLHLPEQVQLLPSQTFLFQYFVSFISFTHYTRYSMSIRTIKSYTLSLDSLHVSKIQPVFLVFIIPMNHPISHVNFFIWVPAFSLPSTVLVYTAEFISSFCPPLPLSFQSTGRGCLSNMQFCLLFSCLEHLWYGIHKT